jgi:chromosome segregation ATPase
MPDGQADITAVVDGINKASKALTSAAKDVEAVGESGMKAGTQTDVMSKKFDAARKKVAAAQKQAAKMKNELDAMAKKLDKAGDEAREFDNVMDTLKKGLAAVGITLSIRAIAAMTQHLIEVGNAAMTAELGFAAMSGGFDVAASNMDAMRTALRGTVDDAALAQIGAALLATEIATTDEEMAQFVRTAAILGGTFRGLGAAEAAAEMSLLAQNIGQSLARADSFGVSAAKVREESEKLMAATAGLNKEEARLQAFLKVANEQAEELAGTMLLPAKSFDRLAAASKNAGSEMGRTVSTALAPLADTLANILQGFAEHRRALREQTVDLALASDSYSQYTQEVWKTGRAQIFLDEATFDAIQANTELAERYIETASAAEEQRSVQDELAAQVLEGTLTIEEYEMALESMKTESQQVADMQREQTEATRAQEQAIKDAAAAAEAAVEKERDALDSTRALTEGRLSEADVTNQLIDDLGNLGLSKRELADAELALLQASGQVTEQQVQQAEFMRNTQQAFEDGLLSVDDLAAAYVGLNEGTDLGILQENIDRIVQSNADAIMRAEEMGERTSEAVDPAVESMDELAAAQDRATKAQGFLTGAVDLFGSSAPKAIEPVNKNFQFLQTEAEEAAKKVDEITAAINEIPNRTIKIQVQSTGGTTPLARGGFTRQGEVTLVGEEGPELAVFPAGTEIIPNPQTERMIQPSGGGGGGGLAGIRGGGPTSIMINLNTEFMDDQAVGELFDRLDEEAQRRGFDAVGEGRGV